MARAGQERRRGANGGQRDPQQEPREAFAIDRTPGRSCSAGDLSQSRPAKSSGAAGSYPTAAAPSLHHCHRRLRGGGGQRTQAARRRRANPGRSPSPTHDSRRPGPALQWDTPLIIVVVLAGLHAAAGTPSSPSPPLQPPQEGAQGSRRSGPGRRAWSLGSRLPGGGRARSRARAQHVRRTHLPWRA